MIKIIKFLKKHWYWLIYGFMWGLYLIGVIENIPLWIDIIFVVFLVEDYVIKPLRNNYIENRVANLVLCRALLRKEIITGEDLFLAQNELVGNTPHKDFIFLQKALKESGLFLEDYLLYENIVEIKEKLKKYSEKHYIGESDYELNYSIFKYIQNLVDNSSDIFITGRKRDDYLRGNNLDSILKRIKDDTEKEKKTTDCYLKN